MLNWDSRNFLSQREAKLLGDQRFNYVPFHQLFPGDQAKVRRAYVHGGGKYPFRHEHYYYPVKKDGHFPDARAQRVIAIPYKKILDDSYMKSLGYTKNPGW